MRRATSLFPVQLIREIQIKHEGVGETALEVQCVRPLRQRLEHHVDPVVESQVVTSLDLGFTKRLIQVLIGKDGGVNGRLHAEIPLEVHRQWLAVLRLAASRGVADDHCQLALDLGDDGTRVETQPVLCFSMWRTRLPKVGLRV